MDRRKENKLSMYLALDKWYESHQTLADTLPGFAATMSKIKAELLQISEIRIILETDTRGTAKHKKITRDQLMISTMSIVVCLVAYADDEKNTELEESVGFTMSDLRNCADTVLRDRCLLVAKLADQNISEMPANYELTQAMIDELNDYNTKYFNLIPMPRLMISEKKIKTESLDTVIHTIDKYLISLDKKAAIKRFQNPSFYNSYMAARTIVDYKKKTSKREIKTGAKGYITDKETGKPIAHARISPGKRRKPVFTDENGFYLIALKKGNHQLTILDNGYHSHTQKILVKRSVINKIDIALQKLADT